jgi:hypothetical protein
MSKLVEVNARELAKVLRKSHDERTPDERRLLLNAYEPSRKNRIARRRFNLKDLKRILFTPSEQLTAKDEARLAGFLGALRIKQRLLEEKEERVAA